jgi:hypothetical protein
MIDKIFQSEGKRYDNLDRGRGKGEIGKGERGKGEGERGRGGRGSRMERSGERGVGQTSHQTYRRYKNIC